MKSIEKMSLKELASYVCGALLKHGVEVVLSGGSVVSIYTKNKYQSYDLDFIENISSTRRQLKKVMSQIGFKEKDRYFKHPKSDFFVEFPSGPLAVGNESVKEILTVKTSVGELKIISPTDCVKDRLAAYYHWKDRPSLDQALMVAKSQKVNLREIKRWSDGEGMAGEFEKIGPLFRKRK